MNQRLINEIGNLVEGKLSAPEIEKLVRFMSRKSLKGSEEDREAFFKHLAREMRQEMKELAALIVEFKRDFLSRIHPEITELRTTYIPQAADQLAGIIESTEHAANQIMDNLEGMQRLTEEAMEALEGVRQALIERGSASGPQPGGADPGCSARIDLLRQSLERSLPLIADSFEKMSFQDLTGQRIKRTIDLVNLMEERIQKTLLSFGLKVAEKTHNPGISGEDLASTVERKLSDLSGPQRPGEGLTQADIDNLLARL
jgi:chemotaxis protein CheZ